MKQVILAGALALATSSAMAGGPVLMTDEQMDEVVAGAEGLIDVVKDDIPIIRVEVPAPIVVKIEAGEGPVNTPGN